MKDYQILIILLVICVVSSVTTTKNHKTANFLAPQITTQLNGDAKMKYVSPKKVLEKFPELVEIGHNNHVVQTNVEYKRFQKLADFDKRIKEVTPFLWSDVKHDYAELKGPEIRKLITLRFIDLKYSTIKALNYKKNKNAQFSPCDDSVSFEEKHYEDLFGGSLTEFQVSCVKFLRNGKFLKGIISFSTGSSQTYTSDNDFSMDFYSIDEKVNLTVYEKFHAVGAFIGNFNKVFQETHKNTLIKTFDFNLLSKGNSHENIISTIVEIFKSNKPKNSKKFVYANRLSVLMLIYNDGLDKMKEFLHGERDPTKKLRKCFYKKELKILQRKSDFCGELLLPEKEREGFEKLSEAKKIEKFTKARSEDLVERQENMIHYIEQAGMSDLATKGDNGSGNKDLSSLYLVCNVLAANYFALEAYVPYGSVMDMLTLQGIVKFHNPKTNEDKFSIKLPLHAVEDSVLMNLAYATEIYYDYMVDMKKEIEKLVIEKKFDEVEKVKEGFFADANSKFSKYFSRLYRLVKLLDNAQEVQGLGLEYLYPKKRKNASKCLFNAMNSFLKYLGVLEDANKMNYINYDSEDLRKIELNKVNSFRKILAGKLSIKKFEERQVYVDQFVTQSVRCVPSFFLA